MLCSETKESSLKFERRRLLRRRLLDLLPPKQRPCYSGRLMPGLCPMAAGKAGNALSQQLELNFICYACKERNLMGRGGGETRAFPQQVFIPFELNYQPLQFYSFHSTEDLRRHLLLV